MNKIITMTTLLISSLFSAATFAHSGHGNSNFFHIHNDTGYILVMLIAGLLVGFITYYDYKKNIRK